MLKISIVMLTTAAFAGLLIADPYGSPMVSAARRTMVVAANMQAAPPSPQGQHEPSAIAKAVVQRDTPVAQAGTNVAAVVNDPSIAPASGVTPTHPQSGRGIQERSDKRERDRAAPDRHIHTASLTNIARHVHRHG